MSERAVIDRFEDGKAVLLVGEDEKQLVVERVSLPAGAREGHWLKVTIEDGRLLEATIDLPATEEARARIAEKLERLRRGEHLG